MSGRRQRNGWVSGLGKEKGGEPQAWEKKEKQSNRMEDEKRDKRINSSHRVLHEAPPRGRQLYFTFPSATDPLFNASKAPFLTLGIVTVGGTLSSTA